MSKEVEKIVEGLEDWEKIMSPILRKQLKTRLVAFMETLPEEEVDSIKENGCKTRKDIHDLFCPGPGKKIPLGLGKRGGMVTFCECGFICSNHTIKKESHGWIF